MLATTIEIIRSGLRADPSLTPNDRTRILALLRNGTKPQDDNHAGPVRQRIIGRIRTAERIDRSLRFVDRLGQQGLLRRVTLPGRKRAIGFLESDVEALITGGLVGGSANTSKEVQAA
jgi:hypothetical protein